MSGPEPWRNPRPAPALDEVRSRVPARIMIPSRLLAWWPALAWGVFIFVMSTDSFSAEHTSAVIWPVLHWLVPSLTDDQFQIIHHLIRKCAHLTEYFIFYLLLYRGFQGGRRGWHWSWAFMALFIAAGYSALDEIHQSFVTSRTASPWDSLIDSSGAFIALVVVFLFYFVFRRQQPAVQS